MDASPALHPSRTPFRPERHASFAVWRLWLDRRWLRIAPRLPARPASGCSDNISVYDRFQARHRLGTAHGGSVVELHAYAVPQDRHEEAIKAELLWGLHALYPEARAARVLDERFLLRRDCPAFPPAAHGRRPGVTTSLKDLALAGDFVALPFPCALMERAAASGFLAANSLLAAFGVQAEPIRSVPARGLLSPPRRTTRSTTAARV